MKNKDTLVIVGIKGDDGEVRFPKAFYSFKWADKYAKNAGQFAVFFEVDTKTIDWQNWPTKSE